jgi:hypothetical protein
MGAGHDVNSAGDFFDGAGEDFFSVFAFHRHKLTGTAQGRDSIDPFADQPI